MNKIFFTIMILSIFTNCKDLDNDVDSDTVGENERFEILPEPNKEERLIYQAIKDLKKDTCLFLNPDISINNLKINDIESANKIIGTENKTDLNEQYHFYSKSKNEVLTLNQHPGDVKNSISIFKVKNSSKTNHNYKALDIEFFESEKGIKLGVSKEFVINILGSCNKEILHSKKHVELYFRIEQPNDSETKILEKFNMPVYYASYKFLNNKLIEFVFGFEYP